MLAVVFTTTAGLLFPPLLLLLKEEQYPGSLDMPYHLLTPLPKAHPQFKFIYIFWEDSKDLGPPVVYLPFE